MITGCIALVAGAAITFGAVATTSAAAFLIGTGVAGIGVGITFLGSFRVLSALASPGQRASLISVIFIASYTAFSIPVVIAGVATSHFGLHRTALVYSAVLATLVGLALLSLLLRGRAPKRNVHTDLARDKAGAGHRYRRPTNPDVSCGIDQLTGQEERRIR